MSTVVICYDGDDAGRKATLRSAPVLLSAGMNVEVANVGEEEDPDSYLQKHGLAALMEVLGNARDLFDFALELWAPPGKTLATEEKKEALGVLEPLLSSVADPVVKNDAAQRIADRLGLQFETVWSGVKRSRGAETPVTPVKGEPVSTGEKRVLKAVLTGVSDAELLRGISAEWFEEGPCRTIAAVVLQRIENEQPLDFPHVATHLKGEAELTLLSELAFEDEEDVTDGAALASTLDRMRRRQLDRMASQLQGEILQAERAGDAERLNELYREKMKLKTLK